jgi:hypothetical protein
MKATPVRLWTAACLKAIRTAYWKAWPLPLMPLAPQKGFAYIRGEYPLAIKRIETAIKQAKKIGLLGKNILGTEFHFDVEVSALAPALLCAAKKPR